MSHLGPGSLEVSLFKIGLIAVLLTITAFAASSETAFFSLNRFQLRRFRERNKSVYEKIQKLLAKPSRFILLVLLLNEFVNITISSFITEIVEANKSSISEHFPKLFTSLAPEHHWVITVPLAMLITIPVILLFGEITPKVIASRMSRIVTFMNVQGLYRLYRVFHPVLLVIDHSIGAILSLMGLKGRDKQSSPQSVLSEDEFMVLMEEGHREGTVNQDEKQLIKKVLEFDDISVAEVMTPIARVFMIPSQVHVQEVFEELKTQKYSRVPIYQKNRKHIIGVLYVKKLMDLYREGELSDPEVKLLMSAPLLVRPEATLSQLFRKFKEAKTHMAICVDRGGDAMGVVTMEDVLESIFGEIEDERDVR